MTNDLSTSSHAGEPCVDIFGNIRDVGEEWAEECDCNVCYEGQIQNHTVTYAFVVFLHLKNDNPELDESKISIKINCCFWRIETVNSSGEISRIYELEICPNVCSKILFYANKEPK